MLYTNLQEEWHIRLDAIENAKKFIYAATYYIDYDEYGITYLNALQRAAMRGVKVYLAIDSFGTKLAKHMVRPSQHRNLLKKLKFMHSYNVKIFWYKPKSLVKKRIGAGSHVKCQITDQGSCLISTGNITKTSYEKWQDISLLLDPSQSGHCLEELGEYFPDTPSKKHIKTLKASFANISSKKFSIIHHNPNHDCSNRQILFNSYHNPITSHIVDCINSTQKQLYITSFYFKPNTTILRALINAAKRGVDINILHSHIAALGCSTLPWLPCYKPMRKLLQFSNVNIYEDKKGHHTKFIISDSTYLIYGTYNLEHAAHDRLSEIIFSTENKKYIDQLNNYFTKQIRKKHVLNIQHSHLENVFKDIKKRYYYCKPIERLI